MNTCSIKLRSFPPAIWKLLADSPWGQGKQAYWLLAAIQRNYCFRRHARQWACTPQCQMVLADAIQTSLRANPSYLPAYLSKVLQRLVAEEADERQARAHLRKDTGGEFTISDLLEVKQQ